MGFFWRAKYVRVMRCIRDVNARQYSFWSILLKSLVVEIVWFIINKFKHAR